MKKLKTTLISAALIAAMALSLTSCGGNDNKGDGNGNVTNTDGVTTTAASATDDITENTMRGTDVGTLLGTDDGATSTR